jgi:glc operon protein GlcG
MTRPILLALLFCTTLPTLALCQDAAPLVTRSRFQLEQSGAELVVDAAVKQAKSMELAVNIWVVDDGGHPIAFIRMDNARPGSAYTALSKGRTAAITRRATGPIRGTETPEHLWLDLSLQNAASDGGAVFTTLYGGVPIVIEGQVVGAVGVGGATGEQDAEIARAGIAALMEAMEKTPPAGLPE